MPVECTRPLDALLEAGDHGSGDSDERRGSSATVIFGHRMLPSLTLWSCEDEREMTEYAHRSRERAGTEEIVVLLCTKSGCKYRLSSTLW